MFFHSLLLILSANFKLFFVGNTLINQLSWVGSSCWMSCLSHAKDALKYYQQASALAPKSQGCLCSCCCCVHAVVTPVDSTADVFVRCTEHSRTLYRYHTC